MTKETTQKTVATTKQPKVPKVAKVKIDNTLKAAAFSSALVKEFGEGSVITRTQMLAVFNQSPDAFHWSSIYHGADFKVGPNRYVATTLADVASVRDAAQQRMATEDAQKLPVETKKSAEKLLKAISDTVAKTKKPSKAKKGAVENEMPAGALEEGEDINAILKTASN